MDSERSLLSRLAHRVMLSALARLRQASMRSWGSAATRGCDSCMASCISIAAWACMSAVGRPPRAAPPAMPGKCGLLRSRQHPHAYDAASNTCSAPAAMPATSRSG